MSSVFEATIECTRSKNPGYIYEAIGGYLSTEIFLARLSNFETTWRQGVCRLLDI